MEGKEVRRKKIYSFLLRESIVGSVTLKGGPDVTRKGMWEKAEKMVENVDTIEAIPGIRMGSDMIVQLHPMGVGYRSV